VVLSRGPSGPIGKRIDEIEILGLPVEPRNELLARLPLHPGDVVSEESAEAAGRAVREFDEHLNLGFVSVSSSQTRLQIVGPDYDRPLPAQPTQSGRVRVSSDVMQALLKSAPPPVYPALAQQAVIQGVVKLKALIGKDGAVQNLGMLSGHPLLVPAALAAMKLWAYEPLAVNGAPAEVESEIDVNFTLPLR